MNNISVNELKSMTNINIIDIRSREKYNDNHIPNSINIPFNEIILNLDKYFNKNELYYIYCQKGFSSKNVALELTRLGFNVTNLTGGYELYKKHKLF